MIFKNSTSTLGTLSFSLFEEESIESFSFKETDNGNTIEIVKRQKPITIFNFESTWPPIESSDRVFKEIYGISMDVNGEKIIKLIKTIEANVTPGHYVEESIEFPE